MKSEVVYGAVSRKFYKYTTSRPSTKTTRSALKFRLFNPELLAEGIILRLTLFLEIFQMATTIRNHLQKSPARMMILFIILQVRRELIDSLAQNRHLDLRGSGVRGMALVLFHHDQLFLYGKHGLQDSTKAKEMQEKEVLLLPALFLRLLEVEK